MDTGSQKEEEGGLLITRGEKKAVACERHVHPAFRDLPNFLRDLESTISSSVDPIDELPDIVINEIADVVQTSFLGDIPLDFQEIDSFPTTCPTLPHRALCETTTATVSLVGLNVIGINAEGQGVSSLHYKAKRSTLNAGWQLLRSRVEHGESPEDALRKTILESSLAGVVSVDIFRLRVADSLVAVPPRGRNVSILRVYTLHVPQLATNNIVEDWRRLKWNPGLAATDISFLPINPKDMLDSILKGSLQTFAAYTYLSSILGLGPGLPQDEIVMTNEVRLAWEDLRRDYALYKDRQYYTQVLKKSVWLCVIVFGLVLRQVCGRIDDDLGSVFGVWPPEVVEMEEVRSVWKDLRTDYALYRERRLHTDRSERSVRLCVTILCLALRCAYGQTECDGNLQRKKARKGVSGGGKMWAHNMSAQRRRSIVSYAWWGGYKLQNQNRGFSSGGQQRLPRGDGWGERGEIPPFTKTDRVVGVSSGWDWSRGSVSPSKPEVRNVTTNGDRCVGIKRQPWCRELKSAANSDVGGPLDTMVGGLSDVVPYSATALHSSVRQGSGFAMMAEARATWTESWEW